MEKKRWGGANCLSRCILFPMKLRNVFHKNDVKLWNVFRKFVRYSLVLVCCISFNRQTFLDANLFFADKPVELVAE